MSEYIEVIGQLVPKNNRNFAIADVNDLRGGYIQVETVDEMNAFLATDKLKEGMLCYVKTVDNAIHMYQYNSGEWLPWIVEGGGGGSGMTLITVNYLSDLNSDTLKIPGQIVYVNEVNEIRYYNNSTWNSFSKIYIQNTPPDDKGGIWIDTSDDKVFLDSNGVIQNLLQVISVLQEKISKLEWAFNSQMDFGNFTNNKYYEYDNQPAVDPTYGTSVEEDLETQSETLLSNVTEDIEPTEVKSMIPNGVHLCIKSGTYAEMLVNKDDFLPKELLWCYDKQQLWIKDPKTLKLIQIGSSTGGGDVDDETMEQILTEVIGVGSGAITKIVGIEMADMTNKENTYLVQVKDGKLNVHDYRLDQNTLAGNAQTLGTGIYYSSLYFPVSSANVGTTTSPKIYINMVYCGGESGKYSYNPSSHNFVELSNLGNTDVNLKGLYLHYTERGTFNWVTLPLSGILKSKSTFLIRGAQSSVKDVNTTLIKVDSYDMEWKKSLTNNNTLLEIAEDVQAGVVAHSIWDEEELIKFESNCSFYISGAETNDYFATNILNTSSPWLTGSGVLKWYVDLVGIGKFNNVNMPCEVAPFPTVGQNTLLMRYYAMDNVSQATKALADRNNSKDWYYINLANVNPSIDISDYTPRASYENKNIFFNKNLLKEGAPNIVTCTFGHNAHTTRCFNWVSVGYYDEYLWLSEDGITWEESNKFQSFKAGDGRAAVNNRENAIYNRIRSITTDGTPFTTHKIIRDFTEPISGVTKKWYYKVGRDNAWTDVRSFTLRNRTDVITNGYNFLQVTDQQGFNHEEYEAWRLSAEFINADKVNNTYDFCLNTGDATQSGNRINEWLDYFKAGESIFKDTEQVYTIGNNDLCPLDVYTLGVGDDLSKMNPINVEFFFTFEHPYSIPRASSGKYVPCVYSFVYGNTYFLSMNSEITEDSKVDIFGDIEGENVYTELETWCLSDLASHAADLSIKWKVAYAHESPFTIITQASIDTYLVSGAGGYTKKLPYERGGSRLNTIGSYWFSKFLQNNDFKLCLCGHKHTYSNSRYMRENEEIENIEYAVTMEPIIYDADYIPATETEPAVYPAWYSSIPDKEKLLIRLTNDNTQNYVKYVMCQATGYKLSSNKELPASYIPWMMEYYPMKITNGVIGPNDGQMFSHYIIWNVGSGTEKEDYTLSEATPRDRIKGLPYKLQKSGAKWAYKYNTPFAYTALSKVGGNGLTPNNNIIIEEL